MFKGNKTARRRISEALGANDNIGAWMEAGKYYVAFSRLVHVFNDVLEAKRFIDWHFKNLDEKLNPVPRAPFKFELPVSFKYRVTDKAGNLYCLANDWNLIAKMDRHCFRVTTNGVNP